jgi:hypothetical protein
VHFVRRRARKKISDRVAGDWMYRRSNLRDDVPRPHSTLTARSQIQGHARRKPADERKVFSIWKCPDDLWQMKRKRKRGQSCEESNLAGCAFGKVAWSIASRQGNNVRIAGPGSEFYLGCENVARESISDLSHAADIPDRPEFSTDQLAQDVLGARPTRATRIGFGKASHLSVCDPKRSSAFRMTDGKDQFTAPALQFACVRRRLMVFLEPAPITTPPSHVLL